MYKLLLCWRYLKTRYLALACIVSVMLGVATLIIFLSELTSNTATAATFLPVATALAVPASTHPLMLAIPAVLGYNGLVRANRVTLGRLTSLANRLIRAITTGESPASAISPRPGAGATHPATSGAL